MTSILNSNKFRQSIIPLAISAYTLCFPLFFLTFLGERKDLATAVILLSWSLSEFLINFEGKNLPPSWKRAKLYLFEHHRIQQFFLRQLGFLLLVEKFVSNEGGIMELAFLSSGFMMVGYFWMPSIFWKVFVIKVKSSLIDNEPRGNNQSQFFDPSDLRFRKRITKIFRVAKKFEPILFLVFFLDSFTVFRYTLWTNIAFSGGLILYVFVSGFLSVQKRYFHKSDERIFKNVESYEPSFVLYFSASDESFLYQISQWLPHLRNSGHRFIVITREGILFEPLVDLCEEIPVLQISQMGDLEKVIGSSVKGAFYVNPGMKNSHLIRLRNLTHIQLGHGESDKLASSAKTMRLYDIVAVAGLAAVNRFTDAGVNIHESQLRIIGRPQHKNLSITEPNVPVKSILYAPTWESPDKSNNYSSVKEFGIPLLRFLINEYPDLQILVKIHPLTGSVNPSLHNKIKEMEEMLLDANQSRTSSSQNQHRFMGVRSQDSINDVFEEADAMICDISSVLGDFLCTLKPTFLFDVQNIGEKILSEEYPTTRGSYYIPSVAELPSIIESGLVNDIKREERLEAAEYIFGERGKDSEAKFFALLNEIANPVGKK